MYRKRLAALLMTGCLLTSVGCSTTSGSGPLGFGLLSGCCGHSSSGGSRPAPMAAAAPVVGGYGGVDCPCSHHGGGEGVFHPAVLSQGMTSAPISGGMPMGDGMAHGIPAQQFQGQPIPVTTPGVPPNMNPPMFPGSPIPGPSTLPPPGQGPRIQPVPQASATGIMPSTGIVPPYAQQSTWVPGAR